MKKKVALSLLVIGLVVVLVAGTTMAWFDAHKTVNSTITAGTLDIDLKDGNTSVADATINLSDNWVPGDSIAKTITIANTGNNDAYVRVKFTPCFTPRSGFEGTLDLSKITYDSLIPATWKANGGYLYYTAAVPVNGTVDVPLKFVFSTDANNDYQGSVYSMHIEAEAIQVKNGAALAQWGVDPTLLP